MPVQGQMDISDDTVYIHLAVPSIKGIADMQDLPRLENLRTSAQKYLKDLARYEKALKEQINKLKGVS